jgi:mono/diheme cytochrome c family protein
MIMIRNRYLVFFILVTIVLISNQELKGQDGKTMFDKACKVCHTIGGGRTIGPDLLGVNENREKKWLISFIKSSKNLIKKGDADALAIFEEYMKIPMPDQNFTDSEINQMLQYIQSEGGVNKQEIAKLDQVQIIGNINSGRDLFSGDKPFEKRGISCISCHTVNDNASYFGGSLAKDLTKTYATMQKAGIESVLQYLSFPAMSDSYMDHPLTTTEIADLTAYLKERSDKQSSSRKASRFGFRFVLYGVFFFLLLLFVIEKFWKNQKPKSVKEHLL